MRKEERLKIIYETIGLAIIKNDKSWQSFLDFSSRIYKYHFDNALLLYAQNPNVTTLATRPIWNRVGRYVNRGEKGIAVFEYNNAEPTFRYLFDIKQTNGKELADRWEVNQDNELLLVQKLNNDSQNINIHSVIENMIKESVHRNIEGYCKGLADEIKNHPLENIPLKDVEQTLQEIIEQSSIYFVNKRCGIEQADLYLPIIEHFDTIPLVARLGFGVTETSKEVLLKIEKTMKVIENERVENYGKSRLSEQQGVTSTHQSFTRGIEQRGNNTREVWENGSEQPTRNEPTEIHEFENEWGVNGNNVESGGRSQLDDEQTRNGDVVERPITTDRGHNGENSTLEQDMVSSRGEGSERNSVSGEVNNQISIEEQMELSQDSSFFVSDNSSKLKRNTLPHRLFTALEKQFPQIIDRSYRYLKLKSESGAFMDLYIEDIGGDNFAIAHTFIQNGDVMYDPEIVFKVDFEEKTINSMSFEQSGFMYQNVNATEIPNIALRKELNSFFREWLNNIPMQGYVYHKAIEVIDDVDVEILFNENGKKIEIVESNEQTNTQELAEDNSYLDIKVVDLKVGDVIRYLGREMEITDIREHINEIELLDLSLSYPIHGVFQYSSVLSDFGIIKQSEVIETQESEVNVELEEIDIDDLKIVNEFLDYHDNQIDMELGLHYDNSIVGFIHYSIYENQVYVNEILVDEEERRKGFGTYLLQQLVKHNEGKEIYLGWLSKEGSLLAEKVTTTIPNEEYENLSTQLKSLRNNVQEIDNKYTDDIPVTEEEIDNYHKDIDLIREIERELNGLSDTKTLVRMDINPFKKVKQKIIDEEITVDDLQELTVSEIENIVDIEVKNNYQYNVEDNLYQGGDKHRFKANVEAIKLVKTLEEENRLATPTEQKILAKYVGWGGLANAFSNRASGWENEYQELKLLLDDNEYRAAMESTVTAYYTEQKVIEHMYKALDNFGFKGEKGRKILDPAMGTGNFYSVIPEHFADSSLYGVELDSITGRIAKQLYQKANIEIKGFETIRFEDNTFDVAIGNIPFNNIKLYDKRYEKEDFMIHDYFIAKSIDLVKKGGIVAYITSKGTLDKQDASVRRYIAKRADLIGAIRLPNTAFKSIAGTEVTTDIIFLQKREIELAENQEMPDWVYTEFNSQNRFTYNKYFVNNPNMVIGELVASSRMYGRSDLACELSKDKNLYEELEKAIGELKAEFKAEITIEIENTSLMEDDEILTENIKAPEGVKNMTYYIDDNKIYYCEKGRLILQNIEGKKAERIKGLCEVKTELLNVVNIQSNKYGYEEDELKNAQIKLNEVYDKFVKSNGYINTKANTSAFSDDDQLPLLCSIEDVDNDKNIYTKSPIFTKATIKSYTIPTSVDTVQEALELSLNFKAGVDLDYMEKLYRKSKDEIIEELGDSIFLNPEKYYGNYYKGWEIREEYLSGNVFDKLKYASLSASNNEIFERNVEALEKVQPEKLLPSDIHFNIGSTWIPIEVYQEFMYEVFETSYYGKGRIELNYSEYTTNWSISSKSYESNIKTEQTYGSSRKNGYEIFEDSLNNQIVTIKDRITYYEDGNKKERYVVNPKETTIARSKQQALKEKFKNWLFSEHSRSEMLLKIYNERFNTIRPREYDGSHLIFPNMSTELELRPHQKNVVARIVYNGTCLMAHEVGAGKTAAMLAAGTYMKSIGTIKKPIYVVPNHLTGQWANELLRFFPTANVLTTTKKDFEKSNRKRFISKIAMGEYDAVIIGHSQFEKIPISKQRQEEQIHAEISKITFAINEAKAEKGENWSVKQMVIFKKNLEKRLENLNKEERKDDLLDFEQLGVDYMFVDEAHVYKNLYTYTKLRNVAGIGKSSSQRANDMYMKCRYLQEMHNGKGITFATGTPISNSMSEMYVMQNYLQPEMLRKMQLNYFDAWAAMFGEITSSLEIKPEGSGYQIKTRFSKFNNLPELMNMFKEVTDIQTAEMLNLPVPKIAGGKAEVIVSELTNAQKLIMDDFVIRAERIRAKEIDSQIDNMLKLTTEAKLMAIDPRLLDDTIEEDPQSKLNMCINKTFEIYESSKEQKSTQVIFCDSGTPRPDKFNVYDEVKSKLIEKGVSEDEIAFIHDANSETQKEEMFRKVRSGEIRVLLGSTGKLGTGTNIQNKLIAMHHLDVPWRPSDITQRDGRGVRQGNENEVISIFRYVTSGSFDSYLWQIQEQKLKYISQVMTNKSISRSMEDVDETVLTAAEVKAIATSNPLLSEKMEVDNKVTSLKLLKGAWLDEKTSNERNINIFYPNKIIELESQILSGTKDLEVFELNDNADFKIEIDGRVYDERVKAGDDLFTVINAKSRHGDKDIHVGKFKGFDLFIDRVKLTVVDAYIKGEQIYRAELGDSERGAITRIENLTKKIKERLDMNKESLKTVKNNLESAKIAVLEPFHQEEELQEALKKQTEIDTALEFDSLSNGSDVIIDEGGEAYEVENQKDNLEVSM